MLKQFYYVFTFNDYCTHLVVCAFFLIVVFHHYNIAHVFENNKLFNPATLFAVLDSFLQALEAYGQNSEITVPIMDKRDNGSIKLILKGWELYQSTLDTYLRSLNRAWTQIENILLLEEQMGITSSKIEKILHHSVSTITFSRIIQLVSTFSTVAVIRLHL